MRGPDLIIYRLATKAGPIKQTPAAGPSGPDNCYLSSHASLSHPHHGRPMDWTLVSLQSRLCTLRSRKGWRTSWTSINSSLSLLLSLVQRPMRAASRSGPFILCLIANLLRRWCRSPFLQQSFVIIDKINYSLQRPPRWPLFQSRLHLSTLVG